MEIAKDISEKKTTDKQQNSTAYALVKNKGANISSKNNKMIAEIKPLVDCRRYLKKEND